MYNNPYSDVDNNKGQCLKANFHTHAGRRGGTNVL